MSSEFEIIFTGFDEILKNMDELEQAIDNTVKQAVTDCGMDLDKVSTELAPLLEGDLQGSADLDIKKTNEGWRSSVTFKSPYALRRHEEQYRPGVHKEYNSDGQYVGDIIDGRGPFTRSKPSVDGMEPGRKYLERPVKKYEQKYQNYIGQKVGEVIDK